VSEVSIFTTALAPPNHPIIMAAYAAAIPSDTASISRETIMALTPFRFFLNFIWHPHLVVNKCMEIALVASQQDLNAFD